MQLCCYLLTLYLFLFFVCLALERKHWIHIWYICIFSSHVFNVKILLHVKLQNCGRIKLFHLFNDFTFSNIIFSLSLYLLSLFYTHTHTLRTNMDFIILIIQINDDKKQVRIMLSVECLAWWHFPQKKPQKNPYFRIIYINSTRKWKLYKLI